LGGAVTSIFFEIWFFAWAETYEQVPLYGGRLGLTACLFFSQRDSSVLSPYDLLVTGGCPHPFASIREIQLSVEQLVPRYFLYDGLRLVLWPPPKTGAFFENPDSGPILFSRSIPRQEFDFSLPPSSFLSYIAFWIVSIFLRFFPCEIASFFSRKIFCQAFSPRKAPFA